MSISELLEELSALEFEEDYLSELDDIAERLVEEDARGEAIEPVFRFLETHRDIDLGLPGPLVHYLERFFHKGYEEKLMDSLRRAPTPRTVWMLNRLLNGLAGSAKEPYLLEMKRLTSLEDPEVTQLALRFAALHDPRSAGG
ncbi:MAG TPA: hypothetical protein VEG34_15460 [Thermoanaerobaculia bacterium]|nr:hypothetical protein [Thermoanaerobaculia bacterium]